MKRAVDAPGCRVGRIVPGQCRLRIIGIAQQKIRCLDLGKVKARRVDQKQAAVVGDGQTKVVRDRLSPAFAMC